MRQINRGEPDATIATSRGQSRDKGYLHPVDGHAPCVRSPIVQLARSATSAARLDHLQPMGAHSQCGDRMEIPGWLRIHRPQLTRSFTGRAPPARSRTALLRLGVAIAAVCGQGSMGVTTLMLMCMLQINEFAMHATGLPLRSLPPATSVGKCQQRRNMMILKHILLRGKVASPDVYRYQQRSHKKVTLPQFYRMEHRSLTPVCNLWKSWLRRISSPYSAMARTSRSWHCTRWILGVTYT
mmetsp:Transcript_37730/g.108749  ORF Transcript_37730/g.108749 Transcript_37730/m.108749 type:complete len:240 (-) Transcript_37730:351-1070(-)